MSPHIRAKSDDLIKAVAAKGGTIGITALSSFLFDPERPKVRPGLDRFVAHVRYVIDLVGVDHAAIGLDFDETITKAKWDADHARWPELQPGWSYEDRRIVGLTSSAMEGNITRAFVAAGFADEDIEKILGLNLLRVIRQVWKAD
jgi:membrane dipeptidase